jgi:hypothetical protein
MSRNQYEQSMAWRHANLQSKKQFKTQPSAGKVMCTVFRDRKGVILLYFLEPGQAINSDSYIATLTNLKARICSQAREENNHSPATRQRQAPYKFEDYGARCKIWLDCPNTSTVESGFGTL